MVKMVETYTDLIEEAYIGEVLFILTQSGVLWGTDYGDNLESFIKRTGVQKNDIRSVGFISVGKEIAVVQAAMGRRIGLSENQTAPVIERIKTLPDVGQREIVPMGKITMDD